MKRSVLATTWLAAFFGPLVYGIVHLSWPSLYPGVDEPRWLDSTVVQAGTTIFFALVYFFGKFAVARGYTFPGPTWFWTLVFGELTDDRSKRQSVQTSQATAVLVYDHARRNEAVEFEKSMQDSGAVVRIVSIQVDADPKPDLATALAKTDGVIVLYSEAWSGKAIAERGVISDLNRWARRSSEKPALVSAPESLTLPPELHWQTVHLERPLEVLATLMRRAIERGNSWRGAANALWWFVIVVLAASGYFAYQRHLRTDLALIFNSPESLDQDVRQLVTVRHAMNQALDSTLRGKRAARENIRNEFSGLLSALADSVQTPKQIGPNRSLSAWVVFRNGQENCVCNVLHAAGEKNYCFSEAATENGRSLISCVMAHGIVGTMTEGHAKMPDLWDLNGDEMPFAKHRDCGWAKEDNQYKSHICAAFPNKPEERLGICFATPTEVDFTDARFRSQFVRLTALTSWLPAETLARDASLEFAVECHDAIVSGR